MMVKMRKRIFPTDILWLMLAINGEFKPLDKHMIENKMQFYINYFEYHDAEENRKMFLKAVKHGKIDVVKAVYKYVDVIADDNWAIRLASLYNRLEVVKFLSTLPGVDATADDNYAIGYASYNGHLEVVKFLSTLPGVDATADNNRAICWASLNGHLDVVKFLSTLSGVDATANNNFAIRWARLSKHVDAVQFLLTLPGVV